MVRHPLSVSKAAAWAFGRNLDDLSVSRAATSAGEIWNCTPGFTLDVSQFQFEFGRQLVSQKCLCLNVIYYLLIFIPHLY